MVDLKFTYVLQTQNINPFLKIIEQSNYFP